MARGHPTTSRTRSTHTAATTAPIATLITRYPQQRSIIRGYQNSSASSALPRACARGAAVRTPSLPSRRYTLRFYPNVPILFNTQPCACGRVLRPWRRCISFDGDCCHHYQPAWKGLPRQSKLEPIGFGYSVWCRCSCHRFGLRGCRVGRRSNHTSFHSRQSKYKFDRPYGRPIKCGRPDRSCRIPERIAATLAHDASRSISNSAAGANRRFPKSLILVCHGCHRSNRSRLSIWCENRAFCCVNQKKRAPDTVRRPFFVQSLVRTAQPLRKV